MEWQRDDYRVGDDRALVEPGVVHRLHGDPPFRCLPMLREPP